MLGGIFLFTVKRRPIMAKKFMLVLGLIVLVSNLGAGTIAPDLMGKLQDLSRGERIRAIVVLRDQADLSSFGKGRNELKIQYLKDFAERTQRDLVEYIGKLGDAEILNRWWISNAIMVSATSEAIKSIAKRPEVEVVEPVRKFHILGERSRDGSPETPGWNIAKINADDVWAQGYTGQGILLGNLDTGVDINHPALQGKYAGHWYDAVNGYSTPYDDNGHGTHTMGTICGGDGPGPFAYDIGVAPGATFVAAKAFDSYGNGSSNWILNAMQWFANLVGNGVPVRIVSNSWGNSDPTSTVFWNAVMNWRNLGIIPVFAVGNGGTGVGTASTPGNYPTVIGVGATNSSDVIASFSARGPAPNQYPWNDTTYWPTSNWNFIKPDVCAPGVSVNSSVPGSGYQSWDGTSMACPHVTGTIALMLEKNPDLDFEAIYDILISTSVHLGSPYPNNAYGWGRIDALAAVQMTPSSGTPDIDVTPLSFEVTLEAGESIDTLLTIANTGDGGLTFDIEISEGELLSLPAGYVHGETEKGAPDPFRGAEPAKGQDGPDAFGYRWIDSDEPGGPSFDWVEISGVGTALGLGDDDYAAITLPFTFPFYGQDKTSMLVSSNGYITFGGDGDDYSNDPIPDSAEPNDLIAVFWDDLNPLSSGEVYYYHDAANNRSIVEWYNVPLYPSSGSLTFEAIIYPDGRILLQYNTMSGSLTGATIGIENSDASVGLPVVYNAAYVSDGLALLISAESPWITVAPSSGNVDPGSSVDVTVTIDASNLTGGTYTADIVINNNDPDENPVTVPVTLTVTSSSFVPGDANGDGSVTASDLAYLANYLFNNGPAPDPLLAGDANGDCAVTAADLTYLANYLFNNGPPPQMCEEK